MMTRSRTLALLLALASSACTVCARVETPPAPAPASEFTLVFTASQVGYLEPCGCSSDQRGGVGRAATAVNEIRASGRSVLLVDGGDRFFPVPVPTDELARKQMQLQAGALAEATRTMGYDALVLSARDAAAADSFFSQTALPPLLDTGDTALPGSKATLLSTVAGVKVGLFAVGAGEEAGSTLARRAASLRAEGARVLIAIAARTLEDTRKLVPAAKEAGVDFLLSSRAEVPDTHAAAALSDLHPPVFSPDARGEGFLRLDIVAGGSPEAPFVKVQGQAERESELQAMQDRIDNMRLDVKSLSPSDPMRQLKTEKLLELEERKSAAANAPPPPMPQNANAFTYAFVDMTHRIVEEPKLRAIIDAFDQKLSAESLEFAKAHPKACPEAAPGQASYVGDASCIACHAEAGNFWKTTKHASAFATLEDKGKQFNVDCISCHVVGWEKPGGACSIAQVEGRKNVQCESCHGAGSLHVQSGDPKQISRLVSDAKCMSCHDADNSPHFNPSTYRPRILGPGHGAPLK